MNFRPATPVSFNILHVMRAPVGGLFRHVVDLAVAQVARGHRVGLIADAVSGNAQADAKLADLAPMLALGLSRVPMSRHLGLSDISARAHVNGRIAMTRADIVHGHGAKGGAYARLASPNGGIRVYTPHGGSLHYDWLSPSGFAYLAIERALMPRTDLFLFESAYGRACFQAKVGDPGQRGRVIHNGVAESEFLPVKMDPQATDLLFVGELRLLKGVNLLIEALARLAGRGRKVSATIVGEGPDRAIFEHKTNALGLAGAIRFMGAMPCRAAFPLGQILVVPSRAESLPYVVLEAAAAGVPVIATRVGGIPEIMGPNQTALVPAGDSAALAHAIDAALNDVTGRQEGARSVQKRVRSSFSVDVMTEAVLVAYTHALTMQKG
ncbi:MAG: glycosyltransferase family 4 protein [Xanthobacteraceae bacterium]